MNNLIARIEINPNVMLGKPVIKHTRITVEAILKKLAQNISVDDMLKEYPKLNIKDIKAAIAYASEAISTDEIHIPVGAKK